MSPSILEIILYVVLGVLCLIYCIKQVKDIIKLRKEKKLKESTSLKSDKISDSDTDSTK